MQKAIVIGLLMCGVVYYWGCGKEKTAEQPTAAKTVAPATDVVNPHTITDAEVGLTAKCPVMGSEVTVAKDTLAAEYKGKVYYFCCGSCPEQFKLDPEKFIKESK
ncbi:MAG: YHS domain-containing protein [Planctomycetota bacterium]